MSATDHNFGPPQGTPLDSQIVAEDGAHSIGVVRFEFSDGSIVPYVRVREWHSWPSTERWFAVSTLVHLALNVGDPEVWQIGNREHPQAVA